MRNKKGYTVGSLLPLGITFVVVAIALGIGADVLDNIQDTQTADEYAYNASEHGMEAINELSGWLPTIALVIAAAVIIGIIVTYLAGRFTGAT